MVHAEQFDEGNLSASGRQRKNLLNKDVGLTRTNMGRSCYMAGCLLPYKVLVERLQVTCTPQQQLVAHHIREFYMQMEIGWIGTEDTEPIYPNKQFQDWMKMMRAEGRDELV